jgi:CDP-glucose 4,6-dehydratase
MVSALPWIPDFWQGRRVWLSGHTGFKDSWLALYLHAALYTELGLLPSGA